MSGLFDHVIEHVETKLSEFKKVPCEKTELAFTRSFRRICMRYQARFMTLNEIRTYTPPSHLRV